MYKIKDGMRHNPTNETNETISQPINCWHQIIKQIKKVKVRLQLSQFTFHYFRKLRFTLTALAIIKKTLAAFKDTPKKKDNKKSNHHFSDNNQNLPILRKPRDITYPKLFQWMHTLKPITVLSTVLLLTKISAPPLHLAVPLVLNRWHPLPRAATKTRNVETGTPSASTWETTIHHSLSHNVVVQMCLNSFVT